MRVGTSTLTVRGRKLAYQPHPGDSGRVPLVLCNGMPRSGSTWSFNVAMELLRRCDPDQEVYGGYNEKPVEFLKAAPATARHVVMKCCFLTALGKRLAYSGAARVIYTWRDPADAIEIRKVKTGQGI